MLPLSLPVALLLNTGALLVNPTSIAGPLGSPFSRLSLADKCRVLEGVEGPVPQLLSIVDGALPVPLRGSASGFLRFAGGILLEGTAFGDIFHGRPLRRSRSPIRETWEDRVT